MIKKFYLFIFGGRKTSSQSASMYLYILDRSSSFCSKPCILQKKLNIKKIFLFKITIKIYLLNCRVEDVFSVLQTSSTNVFGGDSLSV